MRNLLPFQRFFINYKRSSLRIIYYHLISDSNPEYYFPNKAISIKVFRNHLSFFKKHYKIISLNKAIELANQNESLAGKLVITFDDGFKENYSIIAPILKDSGISATFFIITNCIDNEDLMWRNKLLLINKYGKDKINSGINTIINEYNLPNLRKKQYLMQWSSTSWPMPIKEEIVNTLWQEVMPFNLGEYLQEKQPYCTSGEIKELSNEGFGIGAHSVSHPNFNKLSYEAFHFEITGSSKIISDLISRKINTFSYPFGNRAKNSFEEKLQDKLGEKWLFLGTKNKLSNLSYNMYNWERDNIEFSYFQMLLRFLYLPIFRSVI